MAEKKTNSTPGTLWNKTYIMLLVLGVSSGSASQMVNPIVSKYAVSLGTSLTLAGTLSAIMSMTSLFCRPFSGFASDRFNRKLLMIISTSVTALCVFSYSLTTNIAVFAVLRVIHGIAFAFMGVTNMAFAASFIPEDRLGEGMGYLSLGHLLPQALGPTIGLWLSEHYGYGASFYASAAMSVVSVLLMLNLPHLESPKREPGERRKITLNSLISVKMLPYALLIALFSSGNGLINSYIALLGEDRGIANVGLFFTVYSVGLVLVRPVSGKLLDKKGVSVILYPAYVIAALGMVVLGAARSIWAIILSGAMKSIGQGSGTPSIQTHSIKTLGRENAGVASSTTFIGQDVGNAVAPIIGGAIATAHGYDTLFYLYAGILLVVGCGVFTLQRMHEKKAAAREEEQFVQ